MPDVIIVEDNREIGTLLCDFLRKENYTVSLAGTGELAKGNLSVPIKAEKSKFLGRFLWGMDMLRETLEGNKEKELALQKEKKTLILSLTHDIRTPLSAIRLYAKALAEEIYTTGDRATSGQVLFEGKDLTKLSEKELAKIRLDEMGFIFQQMYMMNRPKLLFADELTGALNRTSSNEVMDELVKLNNEGTTIVMVTHDAKVAAKCGRVLFIVDGNIKGEYNGLKEIANEKERERSLNNWLLDLGW